MTRGGKRKALVVGISDYASLQKLEFCKKDGQEVYDILSSLGYEISENNKLIGEVKGEKIKDVMYDFFGDINNGPDDTLLFYYSGHGVPDVDGDTYLAPSDINPDEPGRRGFSFEELRKMIQKSVSTRVVAILDCCYSGAAKVSKGHEDDAAKLGRIAIDDKLRKIPQGQGKYILAASQAAQEAYALATSDHSIFTYYLLQGLKGNTESVDAEGNVTPQSLGGYIYRAIMSLPANKRPKQTPITKAEESGNVILAYHPELKPLKIEDTLASMLKSLHEGKVEAFNKMREQNPAISLDFSREDLYGAHIVGANLSSANLTRTNFTQADLEGANLTAANLFRADLEGANLYKANLSKAVLEAANLSNANLTKANLSNANLTRANLSYANVYSADLQQTNLIGADLRGANLTAASLAGADMRGSIFEDEKKPTVSGSPEPTMSRDSSPVHSSSQSTTSAPRDIKEGKVDDRAKSDTKQVIGSPIHKISNIARNVRNEPIRESTSKTNSNPKEKEVKTTSPPSHSRDVQKGKFSLSKRTALLPILGGGAISAVLVALVAIGMIHLPGSVNISSPQNTLSQANTSPTVYGFSVTTNINTPANIMLAGDPDAAKTLIPRIVTLPLHGKLSYIFYQGNATSAYANATSAYANFGQYMGSNSTNLGHVTYTPDQDFKGDDSFTYKANDGKADSNIATVRIRVGR